MHLVMHFKIKITVCVNNNTFLDYEVDSGTAVTLLLISVYNVKLSDCPLQLVK